MTSWLTSGLPRQFLVMKEKRRCSIRFHLLVPGGKRQTEISSRVSSIRADMFNHHNEIASSYSHCPDNLSRLRMAIDKLFYSAKHVRQSGGLLVELIRDLIA